MQLRLMTYNIHRAIGVDRRFRPERIAAILRHHEPDVVLLQEVDHGVPRSQNLDLASELARDAGYPFFALGLNVKLRRGQYGNATLSRHPIVRERNIDLTVETRKPRGCQHATIAVGADGGPRRQVEIFNLHLGLSARERARQVGILARSRELSGCLAEDPCVIGGDFNDWRSLLHPIFTEILGFDCATQKPIGYDVGIRTYPSFSPQGGLDRIYFRGPITKIGARGCRLRMSRVASDHLPVISDLELEVRG